MPFTRTVTMLALAREALERFDNNTDAAQAYLSERLVNDGQLREALVKAAIEYERLEMETPPKGVGGNPRPGLAIPRLDGW